VPPIRHNQRHSLCLVLAGGAQGIQTFDKMLQREVAQDPAATYLDCSAGFLVDAPNGSRAINQSLYIVPGGGLHLSSLGDPAQTFPNSTDPKHLFVPDRHWRSRKRCSD
jgi:hypothetical protein